jgi:hypothetical protein
VTNPAAPRRRGAQRCLSTPITPKVLICSDSAGATYGFAVACRTAGAGFSLRAVIFAPVRDGVEVLNTADGWYPAIDSGGYPRRHLGSPKRSKLVDPSKRPTGTRLALYAAGRTVASRERGWMSRAYIEDGATPECP